MKKADVVAVLEKRNADLQGACEAGLAFARYALEFFDWSRFPNLRADVEALRDRLAATVAGARLEELP